MPRGRKPTHGLSNTRVYRAYVEMVRRCHKPKSTNYPRYGARGIVVCTEWLESFENFFADMGHPPSNFHELDRLNNGLGYFPGNCRWSTQIEQGENRTSTKPIQAFGKSQSISAWSRELGIPENTIRNRLYRGASIEEALSTLRKRVVKRSGALFHFNGKSLTMSELSSAYGVPIRTIRSKLKRGLSLEEILMVRS